MKSSINPFSFGRLKETFGLSFLLFKRELKSQNRETFLGYFWILLPTLIFSGSFIIAQKSNILAPVETTVPFPIYLLTGLIYWQLFADSVMAIVDGYKKARKLMMKITFPVEAMVISSIYEAMFQFAVKWLLLFGTFLYCQFNPGIGLLYAPLAAFLIMLFGVAVGFFLNPIIFFVPDLEKILPSALNVWMLATPIFYATSQSSITMIIARLNPVAAHLEVVRNFLFSQSDRIHWTDSLSIAISVLFLPVAYYFFNRAQPFIRDRIGN